MVIDIMLSQLQSIPLATTVYLSSVIAVAILCELNVLNPSSFFFDKNMILRGELWRVPLSLCFFGGAFSLNFFFTLFHIYNNYSYTEKHIFAGNRRGFFVLHLYLVLAIFFCSFFTYIPFPSVIFISAIVSISCRFYRHRPVVVMVFPLRSGWYPYIDLLLKAGSSDVAKKIFFGLPYRLLVLLLLQDLPISNLNSQLVHWSTYIYDYKPNLYEP